MLEYFRFKEIHDLYTSGQTEDARHQLSELQARYVNLCDENAVLRKQIQGYEDILYLSRSLIFDGIFFWLVTGSIKQGPFCPVCYNRDGLLTARDPFALYSGLGVEHDAAHAFYLGVELARAQTAWELGKRYVQDQPLDWGCLVPRETSVRIDGNETGLTGFLRINRISHD